MNPPSDAFAAARQKMVEGQALAGAGVLHASVLRALGSVPRENFVLPAQRGTAYAEARLPLQAGRVLHSPYEYARLLEAADIAPTHRVLVMAANTGYVAALVRQITPHTIYAEHDALLAGLARATLAHTDIDVYHTPDAAAGLPEQGPFDRIIIDGGVEVLPTAPAAQLADDGVLITVHREAEVGRLIRVVRDAQGHVGISGVGDLNLPLLAAFAAPQTFRFAG